MNSILNDRPQLSREIMQVSEIAGFLWEKGWAERNGGNITINISHLIDDEIRKLPPLGDPIPIGRELPLLKDTYFFCKGTNRRMRDLARWPMDNASIIRISDGSSYEIIADKMIRPTSELVSHLSIHERFIRFGSPYKAVLHTHPTDLVAMSHNPEFLEKDRLTYLLWSMIPETRAFCPRGLGIVPYHLPGSVQLADATIKLLDDYDVVLWEKHGIISVAENIVEAFDQVDTLSKSAQIYLTAKSMGFEPTGTTLQQMDELRKEFNLPK